MVKSISPQEAKRLAEEENAVIIDIREPDEYAGEHIGGARLMPLSVFTLLPASPDKSRTAVFHCQSGARASASAGALEAHGFAETYLMDGGIAGWQKAGLPVVTQKVPIPLPRQLQIVAGSFVAAFSLLSFFMPAFTWLTLLIGLNLLFAGATGICFVASIITRMPWNN